MRVNFSKALLLLLCFVPIAMVLVPIEWLVDDGKTFCVWKNMTGEECYGCGMTRAMICVVKLKWAEAYGYNRLIIVVFPLLVWLWGKWILKLMKIDK